MSSSRLFFCGSLVGVLGCSSTDGPNGVASSSMASSVSGGTPATMTSSATSGAVTGSATTGAGVAGTVTGATVTGGTPTAGSVTTSATGTGGAAAVTNATSTGTPAATSTGMATTTGGTSVACTFTVTQEISSAIATVGIVEWSADLAGITSARIEFGLDTTYGMTAPVDLAEPNLRTLLLGMKASSDYHFRVVAANPSGECVSSDYTITTGPLANNLPDISVDTPNPAALSPGFFMTGQYVSGGGGTAPAYVIDQDGDFVWWYFHQGDVTNARMSYDGKFMWVSSANVPANQGANVRRVSMDGLVVEDFSDEFEGQNHQFTVLPDDTVAFYAYGDNGCDDVKEFAPATGMVRTIVNAQEAHGASGACHLNAIEYSPLDDTLVFSDLDHDSYTKVKRTGETVWVLGGPTSTFSGDGSSWSRQHGLHILGLDRLVIFNNGGLGGGGGGSLALELLLDTSANTATIAWQYAAQPGIANQVMGDVQRMENGNTLVSYSTQGVALEVDPSGAVVQELSWSLGGAFGYTIKRPTLYGEPPK